MSKILVLTEGKKDEENVIKAINKHFGFENKDYQFEYINKCVAHFVGDYISDPYNEGLTLSSYASCNDYEYALEFLVIDVDLKDNPYKGMSKLELLKQIINIVKKLDNTTLILSSPQIEAIVDKNDIWYYSYGDYKKLINEEFNGAVNEFIHNIDNYLNQEKFKNNGFWRVPYFENIISNCNEEELSTLIRTNFNDYINEINMDENL